MYVHHLPSPSHKVFFKSGIIIGPQSAKTRLRVKNFKTSFFAQNSSLGLVDDAQSENIGEKQEYKP